MALGPAQTPVITDPETAQRLPELTVLSAMAHAGRHDPIPLFKALQSALTVIEADRAVLYYEFALTVLPTAARTLLEEYMTATDYPYKSEFGRPYFAAGKAEGEARSLLTFLTARGIEVSDEAIAKITACTDLEQLDQWIQRAAVAERIEDLGGSLAE